jgi:magnesium chelatase accessory protein
VERDLPSTTTRSGTKSLPEGLLAIMSATAASAPGSRTVVADGVAWHVEVGGRGPAVLLLHGTGGATSSWHEVAARLAPHCTVVIPDFPGHGRSAAPAFERLTLANFARGVAAVCRTLEVAPLVAVGHSAGAAVALQLAVDGSMPSLRHVVGVNAALAAVPWTELPACAAVMRMAFGSPLALDLVARLAARPGTVRSLLSSAGGSPGAATIARYEALFTSRAHAIAAYGMTVNWRLAPLLARFPTLGVPATFVVGTDDRWTPARVSTEAARRIPGARVRSLEGAGHLAPEERPDAVAAAILDVVRELGALAHDDAVPDVSAPAAPAA